jgi:hypothetical protein
MGIRELFIDASKYAASDWTKFLYLGILFIITDLIDRSSNDGLISLEILPILIIIWIFLLFVLTGYIFRIVEESVDGSDTLPAFKNINQLFTHGVKDSVVVGIYLLVPSILLLLFRWLFISLNLDVDAMPIQLMALSFSLVTLMFILLQGAVLNMAHHQGKFRAAFYMREIFGRIKQLGLPKFIIVCIMTGTIFLILEPFITDDLAHSLDYVGGTIVELTLVPFLAILTSRFLGIMDRY